MKRAPCPNCGRTGTYVERKGDEDWIYCVCNCLIAKRPHRAKGKVAHPARTANGEGVHLEVGRWR